MMARFRPKRAVTDDGWDEIIRAWSYGPPSSEHVLLAAEYAFLIGYRPGDRIPLAPGEPVPSCTCPECTGIAADDPIRRRFRGARPAGYVAPADVESARAVPIREVAIRLGLGQGAQRGGDEWAVFCPLHDDHSPSLMLNPTKNAWYCFPCGEGGDGIELVRRALRLPFPEVVSWVANRPPATRIAA